MAFGSDRFSRQKKDFGVGHGNAGISDFTTGKKNEAFSLVLEDSSNLLKFTLLCLKVFLIFFPSVLLIIYYCQAMYNFILRLRTFRILRAPF